MENAITLEEERKVWTIHQSVSGMTYYYNRAAKRSQYEMPQCFRTTEESLEHPDWKEYRTAQGKKFYYNASTRKSSWQLPNEVKEFRFRIQQQRRKERQDNNGKRLEEEQLSQAEVLKRKFMVMLKDKYIGINTKWDACIKLCEDDQRWMQIRMSDKKKYFTEYISGLKKISQQEKKVKTQANRVQFVKMLQEAKFLTSESKMHKVAYDFQADPRWKILEDSQKEAAFQQFLDQLEKKEKQEAREKKLRNSDWLKTLMQENNLPFNTKWEEFRRRYRSEPTFSQLHPYDQISTFIDYILEAEKAEAENKIRQAKLRERLNRASFRELVRKKLASGEIGYKTKWRGFINLCKGEDALLHMMDPAQHGTSAHQIFENIMQSIRDSHKKVKGLIKGHFRSKGFRMSEDTSRQEFYQKLEDLEDFSSLKEGLKQYFYNYFKLKIHAKNQNRQLSAKRAAKREKKAIFRIFRELKDTLKTKYSIQEHMNTIEQTMRSTGFTTSHQAIFKYYLAFLQGTEAARKREGSKSGSASSLESKRTRKRRKEVKEERKQEKASIFPITIPSTLKSGGNEEGEIEEEGQIKDDEPDKQRRRKHSKKQRKKSSSSDLD